ncbi:MAG: PIN domain-containing protein [Micromonosporaceae bacterium]|nr:PIN domain-containing protein [Micromonosporaceae bacterium]
MIVVDTSVWIDFFAGRDTPQVAYLLDRLDLGDEEVALTDLVLTEILQGLRTDHEVQRVDARMSVFEVLRLGDLSDFRRAAALYRAARRRGVTIRRTSDCLIAAVCVREQVPLLHADNDFDHLARVTELSVVAAGQAH